LALDEKKSDIIKRICDAALTQGVDQIARDLNADGVTILHDRKRRREKYIWQGSSILTLLRGKQILGLQAVGKYDGRVRTLSGEFIHAYPAVIDEAQWHAIQARLDSRKCGTFTARNVSNMTNVLGALVRCESGKSNESPRTRKTCFVCLSEMHSCKSGGMFHQETLQIGLDGKDFVAENC
jgi:hypothetical protein